MGKQVDIIVRKGNNSSASYLCRFKFLRIILLKELFLFPSTYSKKEFHGNE